MASRKPGEEKDKGKQAFKANASYEWGENEEFIMLGSELNIILKSLQEAANTPEFKRNVAIFQGLSAINNIFKDAVEEGLIKEKATTSEDHRKLPAEPPKMSKVIAEEHPQGATKAAGVARESIEPE